MHVRPTERRDITGIVDVAAKAFLEDELYEWLAPKRHQYPTSWRRVLSPRVRARFISDDMWGCVCVPSAKPEDQDKIMGFAWWERTVGPESAPSLMRSATAGSDVLAKAGALTPEEKKRAIREAKENDPWSGNHSSWWDALNRMLLRAESKYDMLTHGNAAMDYAALNLLIGPAGDDAEVLEPLYAGVTHWHLGSLAVDPAFQRRGVGSELVTWGLEVARKERDEKGFAVPISLTASIVGNGVYKKLGFKTVNWLELPIGEDAREGGAAMVWDETETWIEKAEAGTLVKGHQMDVVWTKTALDRVESA